MTTQLTQGGCLCGAVRNEATGQPYNITHCHCEDCRRSSGAAFVTWASFRRPKFHFAQGEPRTVPWAGRLRSFCAACGTPLTFLSGPETEEVDVTVCSFDRPESVSPGDHTWVSDTLSWIRRDDALPAYVRERRSHAA
ncbi:MAG: GFA family protein [Chthoniobacterales bacterium]